MFLVAVVVAGKAVERSDVRGANELAAVTAVVVVATVAVLAVAALVVTAVLLLWLLLLADAPEDALPELLSPFMPCDACNRVP